MIETTITTSEMLPDSREKSLFITNMQQALMWANAAIAIHYEEPEETMQRVP